MSQEFTADTATVDTGSSSVSTPAAEGPWYSSLPEGIRDNESITKFSSVEGLAQGYINAAGMIGRDKFALPRTDAEFMEVYRKLGAPESAEGYQFNDASYEHIDKYYSKDQQEADKSSFRAWAHEAGLSQKQFSQLYDKYMTAQNEGFASANISIASEMEACGRDLKASWGEKMDLNLSIANKAMNKVFGHEVASAIEKSGLGRDPAFIKGMYKLGANISEEIGIDRQGNATRTPNQLQQEIAKFQSHPAYFDKTHPEHNSVMAQVQTLFGRLHPEV